MRHLRNIIERTKRTHELVSQEALTKQTANATRLQDELDDAQDVRKSGTHTRDERNEPCQRMDCVF